MKTSIDLSIVIVSFNTKELLRKCLSSIYKNTKTLTFETIIVDNASQDASVPIIKQQFSKVILIENQCNVYVVKAANQGLKRSRGKYFLFLNSDTIIPQNCLEKMVDFMAKNPKVGLASCLQVDEHGRTDLTCSRFPHPIIELFETNFPAKLLRRAVPAQKVEKLLTSYRYGDWKRDTIRRVDLNCLTPLQALTTIKQWQDELGKENRTPPR